MMTNRKLKTSVIVKTLTEIQKNYEEDSIEYLVLEKSKHMFITMNGIRAGIMRTNSIFKSFYKE